MWIEIFVVFPNVIYRYESLPTRECGLKCDIHIQPELALLVTPYAGVWIEISIG